MAVHGKKKLSKTIKQTRKLYLKMRIEDCRCREWPWQHELGINCPAEVRRRLYNLWERLHPAVIDNPNPRKPSGIVRPPLPEMHKQASHEQILQESVKADILWRISKGKLVLKIERPSDAMLRKLPRARLMGII